MYWSMRHHMAMQIVKAYNPAMLQLPGESVKDYISRVFWWSIYIVKIDKPAVKNGKQKLFGGIW